MAFPLGSLYHGSKFAIEGISEALTFEMNVIGVRVKVIAFAVRFAAEVHAEAKREERKSKQ